MRVRLRLRVRLRQIVTLHLWDVVSNANKLQTKTHSVNRPLQDSKRQNVQILLLALRFIMSNHNTSLKRNLVYVDV